MIEIARIKGVDLSKLVSKAKQKSDVKQHQIVAIAQVGWRVVAVAMNRRGTGEVSEFSIHAEEFLVKKLLKIKAIRFGPLNIAVIRVDKKGGIRCAKPCTGCQRVLSRYVAKHPGTEVYYTNDDGVLDRL